MSAKLILCGNGKVIFVPDESLSQEVIETIALALREWKHETRPIMVFGIPVEVIDNRAEPEPGTVAFG